MKIDTIPATLRFACCAVLVGSLAAACSSEPAPQTATSERPEMMAEVVDSAPATSPEARTADNVMRLVSSRDRSYAVRSLREYSRSPTLRAMVRGEVSSTRSWIAGADGANIIWTIVSVDVKAASDPALVGRTVTAMELGGVTSVRSIRTDFEDKLGRDLTEEELAQSVDLVSDDGPHTQPGDEVALWLGASQSPSAPADFLTAARMELVDGRFVWFAEPPNPAWQQSLTGAEFLEYAAALG